jgi:threonine/homoserine/homoserine lactone efflux protein
VNLLGFASLAAVLVAIPGPAVTLVMKRSVVSGRRQATKTALGVMSGDLFWMTSSVVGLTAVIVASQPLFQAIRLLGAAYLCWLGATLLFRRRAGDDTPAALDSPRRLRLGAFAEGAIAELSNPKALLVFTSVIPQFLPAGGGHPFQVALLGTTFAIVGFAALMAYATVFSKIGLAGLNTRIGDTLLRIGGAILIIFGIRLATEPTR